MDDIKRLGVTIREAREAVQTMSRYKDFDAAIAELDDIRFTFGRKEYNLGADPPVAPMLELMAEGKDIEDPSQARDMLASIMGDDNVGQLLDDGLGIKTMSDLVDWLMGELGFGTDYGASIETLIKRVHDAGDNPELVEALQAALLIANKDKADNGSEPAKGKGSRSKTSSKAGAR